MEIIICEKYLECGKYDLDSRICNGIVVGSCSVYNSLESPTIEKEKQPKSLISRIIGKIK